MNFEEELNQMIADMEARTMGAPVRIVCNHETLDQLWEQTNMIRVHNEDVVNRTGYVARFNGIPITVSSQVETGKFMLIPDANSPRPIRFGVDMNTMNYRGITQVDPLSLDGEHTEGDIVTFNGRNYVWHTDRFEELDQTLTYDHRSGARPYWWERHPMGSTNVFAPAFDGSVCVDGSDISRGLIDTSDTVSVSWSGQPYTTTFNHTVPNGDELEIEFEPHNSEIERIMESVRRGRELKRRKKAEEEQLEIDENSFFDILSGDT